MTASSPARAALRLLALVAVGGLLLPGVGCGLERREGGSTVVTGRAVQVIADEYLFDPSTIKSRTGPLTVTFKNVGTLAHNLKLYRGKELVARAPSLEPGITGSTVLNLPPGKYRLICTVGEHEAQGMSGTLTVVKDGR